MFMSENKIEIKFKTLYQLWQFAQAIKSNSIEIKTQDCLLICNCSKEDMSLIEKHNGSIVDPRPQN